MYEKAMKIVGLYEWGVGITYDLDAKYQKFVFHFGKKEKLEISSSVFDVPEHKSNNFDIYFHTSEVVFKGKEDKVNVLYNKFKKALEGSDLPITLITCKWEKKNGKYIEQF